MKVLICSFMLALPVQLLPLISTCTEPLQSSNGQVAEDVAWLRICALTDSVTQVLIDGLAADIDSVGMVCLRPGRHRVAVLRDLPTWPPLNSWSVDTTFVAGDTLVLQLPQVLFIRSSPADAEVWLDDQYLGRTPLWAVVEPSQKRRVLRLAKDGYQPFRRILQELNTGSLEVQLEPLHRNPEQIVGRSRGASWRDRTFVTAALTLAAGIAAVELRDRANDTFRDYQHVASRHDMESLYNRTRRLDRYSATAYGVFEVGFVASFYFFLRWQSATR